MEKRMSKPRLWIIIFVIFLLAVFVISFVCGSIRYTEKRMYDYPGSVWECQNPYMHLEVSDIPGGGIEGYLKINNKRIEVKLDCVGTGLETILYDTEMLANGSYVEEAELIIALCKCSEKEVTLRVDRDNIFDNQYQEIVLIRQEEPLLNETG